MGLEHTYSDFRAFLRAEGCEAAFDRAFCLFNGHTTLNAALWEMGEAEFIFAHAFDWAATPEGRMYWREIDRKWYAKCETR